MTAGLGWEVAVSDISPTQQIVPRATTSARVIRSGNLLVFVIALSEVGPTPAFRATAFRHDGSYMNGLWSIDYHPDVGALEALYFAAEGAEP
ncbi:MAG: hypothetical protein A2V88_13875 [Elusimicrobia bacterium RBG_16_66_12]|nr:MAG: hypothetical protein A2V88_13875 [Elusimicrobia bacterium RBG_16_66_12]